MSPLDSDLPILRYLFVHHVREFPFLDKANEKEFWQDKLQVVSFTPEELFEGPWRRDVTRDMLADLRSSWNRSRRSVFRRLRIDWRRRSGESCPSRRRS